MTTLEHTLRQGLAELGLALSDTQTAQLLAYLALIEKWTKVYNLTAVRAPAEMLTHHLLDSLAVIAPLRRQLQQGPVDPVVASDELCPLSALQPQSARPVRLLDVGSGAGLPGVVIAICCPDITVHCVDTVAKKAAFIQQVAVSLKLPNLRGIHARVENLTDKYDVISSRAFASLADFTTWSRNALAEQGVWMAMKGKHPADELAALPADVRVFHVEQLQVPGLDAERCMVWMRPALAV
ncbi:MAG: 16S rRNA (guanine(527)-N(7))-methyltransferase RsmG [Rhodoferax sp.]|nr:16S rRNA (guanine(527)-N(7))-methyltransferase RsmG [Rhodoferax sp.]OIP20031.1 MAG: 16S rRNA (guanine(527)-N(7))-methyltransferase RsmG [Comamonadaceae bacterium CG2_30_60_41]PIW10428.1 MAG: 16S rRNA (guanine(527)-N(7))-methyltransferase RsmG [Comamonadaceae bacterium CG17_big_fil_post_rev_8_21_14_2_50_60_13]PIY25753.1 MAG: 16S rRNA (guanine(527)-N(7))-methyltransferase RsmG [Comamonadaceae bacterium CG_4_10_14_3_um_filter_60_75]PJC14386.1 MAG: 16S rRNA (guanine(527)-N(7))-methyltransferase 